jgi:hypothetical protein
VCNVQRLPPISFTAFDPSCLCQSRRARYTVGRD